MKTNYGAHDAIYQRLRRAGDRAGWDSDEQVPETLAQLEEMLSWLPPPEQGEPALELGSGAGQQSLHLAAKGYRVTGIDISATAVAWATEHARNASLDATFIQGSVLDLNRFADSSFALVVDGHLLHCIIGGDRATLLPEVLRVLRPGGAFVVNTMADRDEAVELAHWDPPSRCCIWPDGTATRYIGNSDDILAELKDAGFEIGTVQVTASAGQPNGHLMAVASRPA